MNEVNKINYPTIWEYRIIATSIEEIENAVKKVLQEPQNLEPKNRSKNNRFVSMHLKVLVRSQDERDIIFQQLKKEDGIKMIL
ncbi:MAG: DUF493 domain-containing protein [Helicobacter sp.]|nr:DUF493 domain-containing protein [Helicobacter sp.]